MMVGVPAYTLYGLAFGAVVVSGVRTQRAMYDCESCGERTEPEGEKRMSTYTPPAAPAGCIGSTLPNDQTRGFVAAPLATGGGGVFGDAQAGVDEEIPLFVPRSMTTSVGIDRVSPTARGCRTMRQFSALLMAKGVAVARRTCWLTPSTAVIRCIRPVPRTSR